MFGQDTLAPPLAYSHNSSKCMVHNAMSSVCGHVDFPRVQHHDGRIADRGPVTSIRHQPLTKSYASLALLL